MIGKILALLALAMLVAIHNLLFPSPTLRSRRDDGNIVG